MDGTTTAGDTAPTTKLSRQCFEHLWQYLTHYHIVVVQIIITSTLSEVTLFFLFMAAPTAHGSSQTSGWLRATAASLHHSHSNAWSEQRQILNPMSKARDWTCVLMDTSWVRYLWATMEPPRGYTWDNYSLSDGSKTPNQKHIHIGQFHRMLFQSVAMDDLC